MHPFRRLAPLIVLTAVVAAGCGSAMTDIQRRPATTTAARAVIPFCEAVQRSEQAAAPVSRRSVGQRIADVDRVADQVREANDAVGALAPAELRADVDLVAGVVNRQLRLLEGSGGDTAVLATDPELSQATADPAYRAASRRITDYVRRTC